LTDDIKAWEAEVISQCQGSDASAQEFWVQAYTNGYGTYGGGVFPRTLGVHEYGYRQICPDRYEALISDIDSAQASTPGGIEYPNGQP